MLAIIETQHRPLTDEEFGIIRSHPNRGGQYLSIDEDLARYVDIARGHHKFYNGKGGYPNDFDNTASPERFMIDIITVCDCLDAATDQYGRNYHQARNFRFPPPDDLLRHLQALFYVTQGETPEALPLDSGRALPCTREGSSTLSTPFSRFNWSHSHAVSACLSAKIVTITKL